MTRKRTLAKRAQRRAAARAKKEQQVQPPERKVGLLVTKELGLAIEACKEAVESIAKDCRARNKRFRYVHIDCKQQVHPSNLNPQGPGVRSGVRRPFVPTWPFKLCGVDRHGCATCH